MIIRERTLFVNRKVVMDILDIINRNNPVGILTNTLVRVRNCEFADDKNRYYVNFYVTDKVYDSIMLEILKKYKVDIRELKRIYVG